MAVRRLHCSYRARHPARTLEAAEALMPRLGISRVADVTRMDRLGLPVWISVRPRSATLRVHAGKGVDAVEARVGALMEAIEYAAAEPSRSAWSPRALPAADVAAQLGAGVRFVDLVPLNGVRIAGADVVPTVACEALGRRRPVFVPAERVFVPYEPPGGPKLFGASTTGLASGNSLAEATLHGLLEVLERDALSMNRARDASRRISNEQLPAPFRGYATAWRERGVELVVRHVPNPLKLACFEAFLHEPESENVALAGGSSIHPDRDVAMARAVCEAAQSRLSVIHGGRDDITRYYPGQRRTPGAAPGARPPADDAAMRDAERALVARVLDRRRAARYDTLPHEPGGARTLAQILAALLARMAAAGFGTVYRHRFRVDLNGLHVVKMIVPRCEDVEGSPRRIGPRLWARVLGGA